MGFAGVYLIFLFFIKNLHCGYLLEPPRGSSDGYPVGIAQVILLFMCFVFFGDVLFIGMLFQKPSLSHLEYGTSQHPAPLNKDLFRIHITIKFVSMNPDMCSYIIQLNHSVSAYELSNSFHLGFFSSSIHTIKISHLYVFSLKYGISLVQLFKLFPHIFLFNVQVCATSMH